MKLFFALLGIVGAGLLGYWLEPHMRYGLTGVAPVPVPAKPVVEILATAAPPPSPAEAVVVEIDSGDTSPPAETVDPAPEPETDPQAVPPGAPPSSAEIVKLMRESVESGQIEKFTVDDVSEWIAKEDEEIDGVKYQTGVATYEAKTIFGTKNLQAKALIKDGKVVRWIGLATGLEIK